MSRLGAGLLLLLAAPASAQPAPDAPSGWFSVGIGTIVPVDGTPRASPFAGLSLSVAEPVEGVMVGGGASVHEDAPWVCLGTCPRSPAIAEGHVVVGTWLGRNVVVSAGPAVALLRDATTQARTWGGVAEVRVLSRPGRLGVSAEAGALVTPAGSSARLGVALLVWNR